jgi:hypothetical protein
MNSGAETTPPTIVPGGNPPVVAFPDVTAEEIAGAPSTVPIPPDSSVGQAIITAPPTEPSLPVGFARLTPSQFAGLTLSKFVLWLIAGAIPGLIISLLLVEYLNFQPYNDVNQRILQALSTSDANSNLWVLSASVAAILRATQDQTQPKIPNYEIILVDNFVQSLRSSRRLPDDKIKALDTCATQLHPLSEGASPPNIDLRRQTTNNCLDALGAISIGPVLDSQNLQALRDISKEAVDARQAERTFWLQVMQLVLLNLLLPTLTALLGYIFGSQQAERADSQRT